MEIAAVFLLFFILTSIHRYYSLSIKQFPRLSNVRLHGNQSLKKEVFVGNKNFKEFMQIHGGRERIVPRKKKSIVESAKTLFMQIRPASRAYLLLSLFCTIVHLSGLPAKELFGVHFSRAYELWRPFTAVTYFGAPSMSMANSLFFLLTFGQQLEKEYGTGEYAYFLLLQTLLLSGMGILLQMPFQATAMISAILYVNSNLSPMEKRMFQFGLQIDSWQLPFCMMAIDCLSTQSLEAAWPHVLGILSGHAYHFFRKIWPALGGARYLQTPQVFYDKFGGPPSTFQAGSGGGRATLDFRRNSSRNRGGSSRDGSSGSGRSGTSDNGEEKDHAVNRKTPTLFSRRPAGKKLGSSSQS